MEATLQRIEAAILEHAPPALALLRRAAGSGYCRRAAEIFLETKGTVLIGTGFPVAGTFETDGPAGAIALYRVLEHLGHRPVFVCGPPLSAILSPGFYTREIPILDWAASAPLARAVLREFSPVAVVAVERPGVARDGRYYNLRGEDITAAAAKFDLIVTGCECPSICFGDRGNEIGMGNVSDAVATGSVVPAVTPCDVLVVATVSNWGVYGVIAAMACLSGQDLLACFDPATILDDLVAAGSVDGLTSRREPSEDGFPAPVGLAVLNHLRALARPHLHKVSGAGGDRRTQTPPGAKALPPAESADKA
jgi:hypothetical protein